MAFPVARVTFLDSLTFFFLELMLSMLSVTFYPEILRENLHKINSIDLVIKAIIDAHEMSTMCSFFFHSLN